ncbi:MAG: hypothetical protein M3P45_06645 [Acidobacteriota bacterium]|nr:hypothetical protein [Acidobacteriota bacterium]
MPKRIPAVAIWGHVRQIARGAIQSMLELRGFSVPATQILLFAAAGIATLLEILIKVHMPFLWRRKILDSFQ